MFSYSVDYRFSFVEMVIIKKSKTATHMFCFGSGLDALKEVKNVEECNDGQGKDYGSEMLVQRKLIHWSVSAKVLTWNAVCTSM